MRFHSNQASEKRMQVKAGRLAMVRICVRVTQMLISQSLNHLHVYGIFHSCQLCQIFGSDFNGLFFYCDVAVESRGCYFGSVVISGMVLHAMYLTRPLHTPSNNGKKYDEKTSYTSTEKKAYFQSQIRSLRWKTKQRKNNHQTSTATCLACKYQLVHPHLHSHK